METQLIIARLHPAPLRRLAALVADVDSVIVQGPETGLVMLVAQDAWQTDFCLGEVLVTTATVELDGCQGFAMLMGAEPERTLLAATVAALQQSPKNPLRARVNRFLARQAARQAEEEEQERRLLAGSRVNFETMAKR